MQQKRAKQMIMRSMPKKVTSLSKNIVATFFDAVKLSTMRGATGFVKRLEIFHAQTCPNSNSTQEMRVCARVMNDRKTWVRTAQHREKRSNQGTCFLQCFFGNLSVLNTSRMLLSYDRSKNVCWS